MQCMTRPLSTIIKSSYFHDGLLVCMHSKTAQQPSSQLSSLIWLSLKAQFYWYLFQGPLNLETTPMRDLPAMNRIELQFKHRSRRQEKKTEEGCLQINISDHTSPTPRLAQIIRNGIMATTKTLFIFHQLQITNGLFCWISPEYLSCLGFYLTAEWAVSRGAWLFKYIFHHSPPPPSRSSILNIKCIIHCMHTHEEETGKSALLKCSLGQAGFKIGLAWEAMLIYFVMNQLSNCQQTE